MTARPRVAIGTFMLESNSHSPVATREEFEANCHLEGDAFARDWRAAHPRSPATVSGFVAAMDREGAWDGVPLVGAHVGASGPVDQGFFDDVVARMCARLRAALPVDGVYLSLHGAAIATADDDPDGTLLERVRAIVGPAMSGRGHARPARQHRRSGWSIARRCSSRYLTNPHTDMAERGAEARARPARDAATGMRPTAPSSSCPSSRRR